MARFGVPGQGRDPLAYQDSRLSGVPTVDSPRDPTIDDTNYPIQTIWRNSTLLKECMLVGFVNGEAQWRCFTDADGTILEIRTDDNLLVQPNGGVIDLDGETVANATNSQPVFTNGATANAAKIQVQVGTTVSPTPGTNVNVGLICANINQFDIDATSGMLSLKGDTANQAMTKLDVDFNTAPGTDPVVPSATGQISLFGNVVTNGTNAAAPVATHSRAVNQSHIDVQLSTAVAPTPGNPNDVGLISVDNQYFSVTGNGWMTVKDSLINAPVGTTHNLGFSYSSPTFTVHASDGSALSATNPALIVLPSKADPGQKIVHLLTGNLSFDDDSGTSDLTGNTWGTTAGTAWGQAMPFYLYAVADDNDANVTIAMSRVPHLSSSPAAATFAISGSAVATTQGSFFGFDSGITVANYDSNPTAALGSFTIIKNDGANDDWTVQTIGNFDGIGRFNDNRFFNMVSGHFGATSNIFYSTNGGDTIPTFQQTGAVYTIHRNGYCFFEWNADAIITTPGSGSGNLRAVLPFVYGISNTTVANPGNIQYKSNSGGTYTTAVPYSTTTTPQYIEMIIAGTGTALVTPADWTTDLRLLSLCYWFFAGRG